VKKKPREGEGTIKSPSRKETARYVQLSRGGRAKGKKPKDHNQNGQSSKWEQQKGGAPRGIKSHSELLKGKGGRSTTVLGGGVFAKGKAMKKVRLAIEDRQRRKRKLPDYRNWGDEGNKRI